MSLRTSAAIALRSRCSVVIWCRLPRRLATTADANGGLVLCVGMLPGDGGFDMTFAQLRELSAALNLPAVESTGAAAAVRAPTWQMRSFEAGGSVENGAGEGKAKTEARR